MDFTKAVRFAKLLRELRVAVPSLRVPDDPRTSLAPTLYVDEDAAAGHVFLTPPTGTPQAVLDAITATVTAHDSTTPDAEETQEGLDTTTLAALAAQYATLKAGIVTINGHMDTILAGPAAPTAAQTGTALKLIAQDFKTTLVGLGMLLDDIRVFVRRQGG